MKANEIQIPDGKPKPFETIDTENLDEVRHISKNDFLWNDSENEEVKQEVNGDEADDEEQDTGELT